MTLAVAANPADVTTPNALNAPNVVDAVPEYYQYVDNGCEVSASCLNCPLPQCKYDDPSWFQKHRRIARDHKVWSTMQAEALTVDQVAERFSVTVRTVFRIIRRCRDTGTEVDGDLLRAFAAD